MLRALLGGKTAKPRARRRTSAAPAAAEVLEVRRMPSATPGPAARAEAREAEAVDRTEAFGGWVDLRDRRLVVLGTVDASSIKVSQSRGSVVVAIGGAVRRFAAADVGRVVVDGSSGDDRIELDRSLKIGAIVFGGWGNDVILGGGGNDQIYGGNGDDAITGRFGADRVWGGVGSDAVVGGTALQGSPMRVQAMSALEREIVRLTNAERVKRGLPPLVANAQLAYAAHLHSDQMAASGYFDHYFFGGDFPTPVSRIDYAGFEHSAYGENIAYGQSTAAAVVRGWMASPGHRANILHSNLTHIGIGVVADAGGSLYFTQSFGKPG